MPLGEFTKQLAQQAIMSAAAPKEGPSAPAADSLGAVFLSQVAAMQRALKEDEELGLYFKHGSDTIRVLEVFLPAPKVAVLTFADSGGFARVIAAVETLQLVAKVHKAKPGAKAHRIALITPKP